MVKKNIPKDSPNMSEIKYSLLSIEDKVFD
jgi:hypothetical protein